MSNASDRRQATRGLGIAGETDSYKPFTGKGNANKWQRSTKQNQYSKTVTGGGISAAKLNFLEEFFLLVIFVLQQFLKDCFYFFEVQ